MAFAPVRAALVVAVLQAPTACPPPVDVDGGAGDGGVSDAGAACTGFAAPPQSGSGTTYYVAPPPTGSPSNNGKSAATPFSTIQQAANLVNAGDTVIVADGTYTSGTGAVVTIMRGGSSGNWVWFKAAHRWGAKVDGQNNTSSDGFSAYAAYVRVEGFEVSGTSGTGMNIQSGDHVEFVGNHIHDIGRLCTDGTNGLDGVYTSQPNVTIDGNVIHDIGRFGPGENGCSPTSTGYQNLDHGVYVANYNKINETNINIQNNLFFNNAHGWSIQLYPNALDSVNIYNNTFIGHGSWRDGQIVVWDVALSNSNIKNNIFYHPGNNAFATGGATLFSNTVVAGNLTTVAAMFGTTPSGVTLSSNIMSTDPSFKNVSAYDFSLIIGSPAGGAGVALSSNPYDIKGCLRPKPPSIGAYESGESQ